MRLPDEIRQTIDRQLGIVSRAQLNAAGVPPGLVRWNASRHWRSLLPGVLLTNNGLPTAQQRLVAALVYAGPDAWLSGASALACHGLDVPGPALPVRIFVPHPQRTRRVGWISIRATRLANERIVERGAVSLSCRPRAVVDAAADAPDDRTARAIIVSAVQQRFARLDDVQHWVSVRRRNGTVRLKRALSEAAMGSWSVPEADMAQILRATPRLRHMWANPELTGPDGLPLTTPDVWFDDVALALMVHSRQFHSEVLDWDATVMGDQDLRDAGVEVVPVTPHAIATAPDQVVGAVLAGYERASRRPRPDVRAAEREPFRWIA